MVDSVARSLSGLGKLRPWWSMRGEPAEQDSRHAAGGVEIKAGKPLRATGSAG